MNVQRKYIIVRYVFLILFITGLLSYNVLKLHEHSDNKSDVSYNSSSEIIKENCYYCDYLYQISHTFYTVLDVFSTEFLQLVDNIYSIFHYENTFFLFNLIHLSNKSPPFISY